MSGFQVHRFSSTQPSTAESLITKGDTNSNSKLDKTELTSLINLSKQDPGQFKQQYHLTDKMLEEFQELTENGNFQKLAGQDGQFNSTELSKALLGESDSDTGSQLDLNG